MCICIHTYVYTDTFINVFTLLTKTVIEIIFKYTKQMLCLDSYIYIYIYIYINTAGTKRYHNVTTTLAVGYVSVGGRLESATGKPLDKR